MKYQTIRESALNKWQIETKRVRANETDNFSESFECRWQNCFGRQKNETDHYSIFCSVGEWNTNLTDYLTDTRFDAGDYSFQEHRDTIFRCYTKILLAASEIMTDFQDMLSTLRAGKLLTDRELASEKKLSRSELDELAKPNDTLKFFTYINNICKHKINNIHICNHHLNIHFADSGMIESSKNIIRINNIDLFIPKDPNTEPTKIADSIEMPTLDFIIQTIINGYLILDKHFKADATRFQKFCNLYKGISLR